MRRPPLCDRAEVSPWLSQGFPCTLVPEGPVCPEGTSWQLDWEPGHQKGLCSNLSSVAFFQGYLKKATPLPELQFSPLENESDRRPSRVL